jgi:hypothetical protein
MPRGSGEQFTQELFDSYMNKIVPYRQKVNEDKEILTLKELSELDELAMELFKRYKYDDVRGMLSAITKITAHSQNRESSEAEKTLYKEYNVLSDKYSVACRNGTDTAKKERLLARIRELQPLFADNHI